VLNIFGLKTDEVTGNCRILRNEVTGNCRRLRNEVTGNCRRLRNEVTGNCRRLRNEVTGNCRRLRNEELHGWHSSSNIIKVMNSRMKWAGRVARMGDRRGARGVLVEKPEGLNPLRRPCEDRIILK